jgi:hypothetical protein
VLATAVIGDACIAVASEKPATGNA